MLLVDKIGPNVFFKYPQIKNGIREKKVKIYFKEIKLYFYPTDLETNMIHFLDISFSSVIDFLGYLKNTKVVFYNSLFYNINMSLT